MVLFNYYPVVVSSVVVFGFLFNKTSLSFVVYILNILLLYSSFGLGLDVLLNRITLTLQIINWFQLDLLLVNPAYRVDCRSGIMLVIIALISLNVNLYSLDVMEGDTH